MRKILTLILTICLLFSSLAYAETNLYEYKYNGGSFDPSYKIDFRWINADNEPLGSWNTGVTLHLIKLEKGELQIPTYCCDFESLVTVGTAYRRLNLEDASYFDEDEAAYIRGIFSYGYWDSGDEVELANTLGISDLTAAEAMAGTQLAIWNYANFSVPGLHVEYRTSGKEVLDANVKAVMDYLLTKSAQKATLDEILFTDEVVSTHAIITEDNGVNYDVIVKFKLVSTNTKDIVLTAKLGEDVKTFNLSEMIQEEDGYYKIVFSNVTESGTIELSVEGTQSTNSVYFYEPKEGRDASQNLVGWATDDTQVNAQSNLQFGFGTKTIKLIKVDKDTELPIANVVFNLYTNVDGDYVLVKSNLVTDSQGMIEVNGLSDEYEYYVKEISAPTGYDIVTDYLPVVGNEITLIENEKVPEPPEEPNTPTRYYTTRTVAKIWDDTGYEENRPESVQVQLYKDGVAYGDAVELNANNNWAYTWYGLSRGSNYTVEEITVLDNYICEVDNFVITNTYVPEEPGIGEYEPEEPIPPEPEEEEPGIGEYEPESEVPKTGDNSWYWFIPIILSGVGIVWLNKKKETNK